MDEIVRVCREKIGTEINRKMLAEYREKDSRETPFHHSTFANLDPTMKRKNKTSTSNPQPLQPPLSLSPLPLPGKPQLTSQRTT